MTASGSGIDRGALRLAATFQHGLLTRGQCLAAGVTYESVRHAVRSGRWVRLASGVYLTEPGGTGWEVTAAAAQLAVRGVGPTDLQRGDGPLTSPPVALFGTAAARAWGMPGAERAPLQLAVPRHTGIRGPAGVRVRRIDDWDRRVDLTSFPWRTTKASTVLDCAADGSADDALAWLARAVQKRLTPMELLERELSARERLRHGALIREALADAKADAHSAAELRYVRDVERPHGLPVAKRQAPSTANGRSAHDNCYDGFDVVIEVDGRLGHEDWDARVKDGRRDRQLGATGRWTSRAFWSDVAVTPCQTAREVAALLRAKGWTGALRACRRPGCPALGD